MTGALIRERRMSREDPDTQRAGSHVNKGRDWSYATISQGLPE